MIGQATLVILVKAFCEFSNPNIAHDVKVNCLEFMTNCSIKTNGIIEESEEKKCEKIYNNIYGKK